MTEKKSRAQIIANEVSGLNYYWWICCIIIYVFYYTSPRKKMGLSTENARIIRQRGHNDSLEFALAIGLTRDYKNDIKAKKDVIDPSGDSHSVKSGEKKWQIFLYGLNRFETDTSFKVMNGIGDILIECIKSFPNSFEEYQKNKSIGKEKLRVAMVKLANKLQEKYRLHAFLNKSLFNGGEVNYLTVKHKGKFHVFLNEDILKVLTENFEVCNSQAKHISHTPEQKVLLRYQGINLGEIEMRNDSQVHYGEIRFNMYKPKFLNLVFNKIPLKSEYSDLVLVYGNASKHFGRWKNNKR